MKKFLKLTISRDIKSSFFFLSLYKYQCLTICNYFALLLFGVQVCDNACPHLQLFSISFNFLSVVHLPALACTAIPAARRLQFCACSSPFKTTLAFNNHILPASFLPDFNLLLCSYFWCLPPTCPLIPYHWLHTDFQFPGTFLGLCPCWEPPGTVLT